MCWSFKCLCGCAQVPWDLDGEAFFQRMAMRAAMKGCSPDLLFFVFYFQPVSNTQAFLMLSIIVLELVLLPQCKHEW